MKKRTNTGKNATLFAFTALLSLAIPSLAYAIGDFLGGSATRIWTDTWNDGTEARVAITGDSAKAVYEMLKSDGLQEESWRPGLLVVNGEQVACSAKGRGPRKQYACNLVIDPNGSVRSPHRPGLRPGPGATIRN